MGLLHQRESTLSGSEDPSLLLSPPSNRCGSPSRNMMSLAPQLSTENAPKKLKIVLFYAFKTICVTNAFFYQCRGFVPNLNIVIVQLEFKLALSCTVLKLFKMLLSILPSTTKFTT